MKSKNQNQKESIQLLASHTVILLEWKERERERERVDDPMTMTDEQKKTAQKTKKHLTTDTYNFSF